MRRRRLRHDDAALSVRHLWERMKTDYDDEDDEDTLDYYFDDDDVDHDWVGVGRPWLVNDRRGRRCCRRSCRAASKRAKATADEFDACDFWSEWATNSKEGWNEAFAK